MNIFLGDAIVRRLTFIAAIIMLVSGPAAPAWAKAPKIIQTIEAIAGEVVFFKLSGDPSAGYNWKFNKQRSTGLDLVKVDQLGWLLAETRAILLLPGAERAEYRGTGQDLRPGRSGV